MIKHLEKVAHAIILQWGWRRWTLAMLMGGITSLALPPYNFLPVVFITFPALTWLMDGMIAAGERRSLRALLSAAGLGWAFGFGYFLAGLWWIGNAFLVEGGPTQWLIPLAVVLLPAALAVFTAVGLMLAAWLWSAHPMRLIVLAAGLSIGEWLRGHLFTGFPWNAFGYLFTSSEPISQLAAYGGLWGLTFFTVLVAASPATLIDPKENWRRWLAPVTGLFLLLMAFGAGAYRLNQSELIWSPGVSLRLVQPNIPQDDKFRPELREQVLTTFERLSRQKGENGRTLNEVSHLIWPESPFPFLLSRDEQALRQIGDLLPRGTTLLTGAIRKEAAKEESATETFYNSLYTIADDGTLIQAYDKVHLVPFGEYLPFQTTLEKWGFEQLTRLRGGFTAGTRRETMSVPRAPLVSPLICYEAIFPAQVASRDDRPQWLLNITNDAWFGLTPGPYQHMAQARLRAIEEGLPLVRVSNNGISAVVDPYGRVIRALALGREGILDAPLPKSIRQTFYSKWQDWPFYLGLTISCLLGLISRRK